MKRLSKKREQGSVLVMTLVTCMVIATVLASYLAFISVRYNLTVRSMGWNAAIPVLEAGVEEAMTHLNNDATPTANGWTAGVVGGQPVHTKNRNFADGSYFIVNISDAASKNPTVYSTGYVPAPLGKGYIRRMVKVTTERLKMFPVAIAAEGKVELGGGAIMDSYNSCLGVYSTNNSLGEKGAIATNFRGSPAISVGNAHVYGTLTTGPGGTVDINGGTVGNAIWNATQTGIQPGYTDDDMNVIFPTNALPTGWQSWLQPPVTNYGGIQGTNVTVLGNDTYQMSSFISDSYKSPMIVTGKATLYVPGDFKVTDFGRIEIQTNASLTLYAGGNNNIITGEALVNRAGQPANFTYIGLPTNNKLTISGQGSFIGTINAPQTDLAMSGTANVYGAAIVKTFKSSGSGSLHYDECLDMWKKLRVKAWKEL